MSERLLLRRLLVFAHGLRGVLYSGNCFVSPEIALKCSQRNRNGENHTETPPRVGRTPTQKPLRICASRFREFSQDLSSKCGRQGGAAGVVGVRTAPSSRLPLPWALPSSPHAWPSHPAGSHPSSASNRMPEPTPSLFAPQRSTVRVGSSHSPGRALGCTHSSRAD